MKFSLQEQNKKSQVGKTGPSSPLAEHDQVIWLTFLWKKNHIFQLGFIWFSTLFTGIEVFLQIVPFFFIDMCCKSHCSKLLLRRQNFFLCWAGSPRVSTHYPFIYSTIVWQKRYSFRKPSIEKWYPSILLPNDKSTFNELKLRKVGMFEIFWLKALNGWFFYQPTLSRTSTR